MEIKPVTMAQAKKLKRKALGFFGRTAVKSLDEMAQLLYQTGIASSIEEGKKITPSLVDREITYAGGLTGELYLKINTEKNIDGQEDYRMKACFKDTIGC